MSAIEQFLNDGDAPELERDSPVPLYYQIQRNLIEQIESNAFAPGAEFPTEKELMRLYGVSRATVRHALDNLVRQGYLTRQRGLGTFVSVKVEDTRSEKLRGFLEHMRDQGLDVGCEILFCGHRKAPAKVAKALNLGADAEPSPFLVHRVGIVENEPMGLAEVWLNVERSVDVTAEELAKYNVLHTFVEDLYFEEYGLRLASGTKTLEATVATSEEARLLGVEPGSPLLLVQVRIKSSTGKMLVYIKTLYRGDRYVYATQLHT